MGLETLHTACQHKRRNIKLPRLYIYAGFPISWKWGSLVTRFLKATAWGCCHSLHYQMQQDTWGGFVRLVEGHTWPKLWWRNSNKLKVGQLGDTIFKSHCMGLLSFFALSDATRHLRWVCKVGGGAHLTKTVVKESSQYWAHYCVCIHHDVVDHLPSYSTLLTVWLQ